MPTLNTPTFVGTKNSGDSYANTDVNTQTGTSQDLWTNQQAINTELGTTEVTVYTSIDSTDSPYAIGDATSKLILLVDSSGGNVDVTLPTLADNSNREMTIIHETGGNTLNVDGEGAEQIGEMTDIDMPKEGDRLKILGSSSVWTILDERISCQLRLDTYAGYGSTDNKIMRFTNVRDNYGNVFSENHSTGYSSNAEGLEITINKSGIYAFSFTSESDGSARTAGLSLNSSQLATPIYSINVQDRLSSDSIISGGASNTAPWTGYLLANDVVRAHTEGVAPSSGTSVHFTASYRRS